MRKPKNVGSIKYLGSAMSILYHGAIRGAMRDILLLSKLNQTEKIHFLKALSLSLKGEKDLQVEFERCIKALRDMWVLSANEREKETVIPRVLMLLRKMSPNGLFIDIFKALIEKEFSSRKYLQGKSKFYLI